MTRRKAPKTRVLSTSQLATVVGGSVGTSPGDEPPRGFTTTPKDGISTTP